MYKIDIFMNCDKDKLISLIKNHPDLVINNKNKYYIITSYIKEKDFYDIEGKKQIIKASDNKTHATIFPFKCNIYNNSKGCKLTGEFHFNLGVKLYLIAFNCFFIYIICNFLSLIFIPLIVLILGLAFWLNFVHLKNVLYFKRIILRKFINMSEEANLDIKIKEYGLLYFSLNITN